MGAMVKSTVARAGHDYMRRAYGEVTWQRMLERLPADDRMLVERTEIVMHYPVTLDGQLFAALVDIQFHGDRNVADSELRKGGAHQADLMLAGTFGLFTLFVSPQQAYRRAGSLIASIYSSDITSRTEPALNANGGAVHLMGLEESSFIAPWHCGWIQRAVTRFGGENATVTERNWLAGVDAAADLVYDVHWE